VFVGAAFLLFVLAVPTDQIATVRFGIVFAVIGQSAQIPRFVFGTLHFQHHVGVAVTHRIPVPTIFGLPHGQPRFSIGVAGP